MPDFGADFAMVWTDNGPEFDLAFIELSGVDVVRNAIARLFVTPLGRLPWAPGIGLDLRGRLSSAFTPAEILALESAVSAQCEDDERIQSATATCTVVDGIMTIDLECETAIGPFTLVLEASDSLVRVLE